MSIICESCCGDGLLHDPEEFEIFHDDPCPGCMGLGVSEDAGDPVDMIKYLANKRYESAHIDFYMGEGVDDYEELPIRFKADYIPAEYGSREAGTGLQLEPDYPADHELSDFHVEINGQWFYFEPTDDQESQALKAISNDDF